MWIQPFDAPSGLTGKPPAAPRFHGGKSSWRDELELPGAAGEELRLAPRWALSVAPCVLAFTRQQLGVEFSYVPLDTWCNVQIRGLAAS